jgi:O-antigen/teichoic acid export membrane protein
VVEILVPSRPESLRKRLVAAGLTAGSCEIVSRVLMAVLSVAVARALGPTDVGVLGLSVIVVGLVSLLGSGAETTAVASREEGTDPQYALGALIIRAVCITVGALVVFAFLPYAAATLAGAEELDERFRAITTILSLQLGCELAGTYPRVILQRRLDLAFLAGVNLLQVAAHVSLAMLALANGAGLVGLAWASVASSSVVVPVVWARLLARESAIWHGAGGRRLWRQVALATGKLLSAGGVGYFNSRVDNLLVAGALGPTAMSFYAMGWNMSRFVPAAIGGVLSSILVPALAEVQSEARRVEGLVGEALQYTYLLYAPLCALVFVSAPALVALVLGERWMPLVPGLRVMIIAGAAGPIASTFGAVLIVTGHVHRSAAATLGQFLVLVTLMVPLAAGFGVVGAACGDLLAVGALMGLLGAALPRLYRVMLRAPLASVVRICACASVVGLAAWSAGVQLHPGAWREAVHLSTILVGYPALLLATGGRSLMADAALNLSLGMRRAR